MPAGACCRHVDISRGHKRDMAQKRPDRVGEHRTAFDRNRKIILSTQNVCGICGKEIDPSFKYPHPLSATVDHIVPVAKGGHPSALSNLQAAHRWCNMWKKDKLMEGLRLQDKADLTKNKNEKENQNKKSDLPLHYDWKNYRPNKAEAAAESKGKTAGKE